MKAFRVVLILLLGAGAYAAYEFVAGRSLLKQVAGVFRPEPVKPVVAAARPAKAPAKAAAPEPPAAPAEPPLILSAPPRESPEDGEKRYGALADYLSQTLGRKVTYRHPITWGGYQTDMQAGAYDILFDGPHFVSWRIEKLGHNALVRLPGDFLYIGFVRKEEPAIRKIGQLAGHTVCVHPPPNLGTLMLLSAFENSVRQPQIVISEGYKQIYQSVIEGKCVGGMLPTNHLVKYDKENARMRVIYSHPAYPEQALTVGPRLSAAEQTKVTDALLVTAALEKLADFRNAYALSGWFVRATNEEYKGLSAYLRTVQGFYVADAAPARAAR